MVVQARPGGRTPKTPVLWRTAHHPLARNRHCTCRELLFRYRVNRDLAVILGYLLLFTGEAFCNVANKTLALSGTGTAFLNTMSEALTSLPYRFLLAPLSG